MPLCPVYIVLGAEPRALCILGKHCTNQAIYTSGHETVRFNVLFIN